MTESKLFAETALLPTGWASAVLFEITADGSLSAVRSGIDEPAAVPRASGPVIPGMPNLHSHAFQRAMAGLAEQAGPSDDSFWTWREVMYDFALRLQPEPVEAIAAQLYVEMLKAGYTAVGEFHYLHHDPQGKPYADLAEMSQRVISAAGRAGIGITHLPVLYGFGGFGGAPAGEGQRRFVNRPDDFLEIIAALRSAHGDDPQVGIGIAPHSLRAVTAESLSETLSGLDALDPHAPVHIHIAEQKKEVHDCIAWCGARPVEWLLDSFAVEERWCLVHATHMTEPETEALAGCAAVAGLCPTTEANLGDGVFPAPEFVAHGGRFGIGSDSHISISPIEELRWLEYGQRLTHRQRNLIGGAVEGASIGAGLVRGALAGGAQALGRPIGRLAPGCRADLVVLDPTTPNLIGRRGDQLLDALVFAGNTNPVADVMVGGRWVVTGGRHEREAEVQGDYVAALAGLMR